MTTVRNLDAWVAWARGCVRRDGDVMLAITGREGDGKSTLAYHLGAALDPTFGADRMRFSAESFVRAAKRLPKGSALVWDEVVEGGLAVETMTRQNRDALKFMITSRALNLFQIVCVPTLDVLARYAAEWRCQWFVEVERRGTALFREGQRKSRLPGSKPYWASRFRLHYGPATGAGWDAYLAAKDAWVRMDRDPKRAIAVENAEEQRRRVIESTAWLKDVTVRELPNPKRPHL